MKVTKRKKLLVFHPIIAPYRIDFFNTLSEYYDEKVVLNWRNLKDQTFDYANIEKQFVFKPEYCVKEEIGMLRWLNKILCYLRVEKPDIVLVSEYGIITQIVLAYKYLTMSKYKIVSITDDSYDMLADNNHFTRRHKFAIKLLAPYLDELINVEPNSVRWYQDRYNKGIYFPIIVDEKKSERRYEKLLPVSESYINQYNLEGKKVLLFVGRLVTLKNICRVIDSFKIISNPNLRFIIVGSGDEEQILKKKAEIDNRIIFIGRKEGDDLYAWYNIANVFILASFMEPFGAVTNEALLGGCRCLVSKKAGSHCLIDIGFNGDVIDPYNRDEIKDKIERELSLSQPLRLPLRKRGSLMPLRFGDIIKTLINRLDNDLK